MNTQRFLTIIVLFATLAFSSCIRFDLDINNDCVRGIGPSVERELTLSEFSKFDLGASFNVEVSQGPVQKVVAVGQENIIDHLNTSVNNGSWDICLDNGCYSNFDLTIYITVPSIDQVKLSGSGKVEMDDFNQDNDLTVSISGSGNFRMNEFESAENLYAYLSGSGSFYANEPITSFNALTVRTSGSGNFNGFPIEVKECSAKTSGSGSCHVYAEEKLDASISGSGDIVYKGSPQIESNDSGSGKLLHVN